MNNKTLLVTGANRGIGLGFCKYYLSNDYPNQSWHIIAAVRDLSRLPEHLQRSDRVTALELDTTSPSSIEKFASELRSQNLSIDLLINNAGITIEQPFGQWTQTAFLDSLSANSIGPALLIQALVELFSTSAKVIQLSSGLGSIQSSQGNQTQYSSYAMSKCAINMLTVHLAHFFQEQHAEKQLCIAAINPGWVRTDMGGQEAPDSIEEAIEKMTATISGLRIQDSGKFLDKTGQSIDW